MHMLDEGHSVNYIQKQLRVDRKTILLARQRYLSGGELALLVPESQPHLSIERKLEIVREVEQKQLSLLEVAHKHLVSSYSLRRWIKAYHQFGEAGLARKGSSNGMKKKRQRTEAEMDELEKLRKRNEYLEAENALLKKVKALVEEREARLRAIGQKPSKDAIQGLRPKHKLDILLEVKGMARSTFYYNHRPKADKWVVERQRIAELYHQNKGRYGYRRLTMAMRNEGYVINSKTVRKLMAEAGIKCAVRMKKYKSYKGEVGKIAPNLLERDFKADAPHKKMVTDVTEFHLFGSKIYLSPVLDLYNSELIFYTIYRHPVLDMVKDMINGTISVIGCNTNAILHSDQGFHYQHKDYQKLLKDNHIIQSMSRKGNCLDNAVMENFFGLLKSELLYLRKFESLEQFLEELEDYLEYYNTVRIKAKLNGMSPVQYRTQNNKS